MISKRLLITISEEQFEFLQDQKRRFRLSFASQVRDMIRRAIEGYGIYISETYPIRQRQRGSAKTPMVLVHPRHIAEAADRTIFYSSS